MSNELKAILEYDAARLEIRKSQGLIAKSMARPCESRTQILTIESYAPFDDQTLPIESFEKQTFAACINLLYSQNKDRREAEYCHEDFDEERPELCARCKELDGHIQDKKAAKKRFGIAKVRLSRIARDYRNKTEQDAVKVGAE